VTNFNAADFAINTTGFQNAAGGIWSIADSGGNLDLNYSSLSAVPEPADYAMWCGAAALGLALWKRTKGRARAV
jgi:hypothetical protein